MTTYRYEPLDANNKEIRILHLQPGSFEDPIHVSIEHIHFDPTPCDASNAISPEELKQIQESLPDDWHVHRTLEDRLIFLCCKEGNMSYSSWISPVARSQDLVLDRNPITRQRATTYTHFEAVSYTWGSVSDHSEPKVVTVGSPYHKAGTIAVGSNLWSMLRHLRCTSAVRTLWIDAVCINQNDPFEKSQQIPRMSTIYTFAKRVVIWLGGNADESTTALRALEYVGKQVEITLENYFIPAPDCTESRWFDIEQALPLSSTTWTAVALLMQRSYFERLWILQEAQAANSLSIVKCCSTEVLWCYVRRALMRCRYEMMALFKTSMPSQLPAVFAGTISANLKEYDPVELFGLAANRKCSEPQDKVFAILGMLPAKLAEQIQPLYTLPVRDVYLKAFLATIETSCRLGLLQCVSPETSIENTATWIPDFTQLRSGGYALGEYSHASSYSGAQVKFQEPLQLHICGVLLGRVKAVNTTTASDATSDWPGVYNMIKGQFTNITEDPCLDAYLWIVTEGDLRERRHENSATPNLPEARSIFLKRCSTGSPEVPEVYRHWSGSYLATQQRGTFFVTEHGQLGCGPPSVKIGDEVCVPLGSNVPLLLKRAFSPDKCQLYNYIGPLYVHGLMEGQALLGPLPPFWQLIIVYRNGKIRILFFNSQTNELVLQDPRLGPLPSDWEAVDREDEARLKYYVQHYRNKNTGEVINSDPRLLPEALKARGVDVTTVILV